jgi:hypothetical protein
MFIGRPTNDYWLGDQNWGTKVRTGHVIMCFHSVETHYYKPIVDILKLFLRKDIFGARDVDM